MRDDSNDYAICGVDGRFDSACVQEWHRLYLLDARAVTRRRIADTSGTNGGDERRHERGRTVSGLRG